MSTSRPLRVAIVGAGPKGLYAFERLLAHAAVSRSALEIDIYEPHPSPGAGQVYDPSQPHYLRMNFAAESVDMWWPAERGGRHSFIDWHRAERGGEPETYPPRAVVGEYLSAGFGQLLEGVPAGVSAEVHPTAVRSAEWVAGEWTLTDEQGATRVHDEVLTAVGHAWQSPPPRWEPAGAAGFVPGVFPVEQMLSEDQVPPGAWAAVRGFALTFLDAALALTEGRGGRFEPVAGHPYELEYLASEREVGVIAPLSRTGRPMLAKPEPSVAAAIPGLEGIARNGRAAIAELPEGFQLGSDFLPLLAGNVRNVLEAAGAEGRPEDWLAIAVTGTPPPTILSPLEEVRQSLDVGCGRCAPDLAWALGHSWRSLYPAIVDRCGGAGTAESEWPVFRRLATQMERIAFGPPPLNAAKLLALGAAGKLDLSSVSGGEPSGDVVIDAVLPPPGVVGASGVVGQVLADGHARVMPGRRGLEVAADASCLSRDGSPTPGLAAIGRPTEDCVIGNDTLSRTLHPAVDVWARRVAERAEAHRTERAVHAAAAR